MLLQQGKRLLVFYNQGELETFTGCISATCEPLEIETRQFGRCIFYTFDNNGVFIQIIGTHCQIEDIRKEVINNENA